MDSIGFSAVTTGCQSNSEDQIHQQNSTAAMMPNRDPSPDPDPPVNLLDIVTRCQNQVARFTMHPADYEKYIEIQENFLTAVTPYAEFRRQMGVLLDLETAQHYRHLRIFMDIYHRAFLGEEHSLDNVLCLFPVVLSCILDSFVHSVQDGDTLRNWVWEPDPERECRLAAQRVREASRIQNQGFNMASRDSIRDPGPDLNPDVLLLCFLNWCQEQVARVIMQPRDYEAYLSITLELRNGMISYDTFLNEMRAVLRNPSYKVLRVWWNVHKWEVYGVQQMLDNPMLRYPLALFITMSLVMYCAVFGETLWETCLENVRRRDGDDVF